MVFLQHEAPLGHHTQIPNQLHLVRPMRYQQKLMSCSQQLKRFLAAMCLNVNATKPNHNIYTYSSRGTFHITIIILCYISLYIYLLAIAEIIDLSRRYRTSQNFRDRNILRIASKKGRAEIFATKIFAKAALIHCVIL